MGIRTVTGGFESYRRASDGLWAHGMLGDEIDVHDDDLERFDRLHPEPLAAAVELGTDEESDGDEESDYASFKVDELKAEIERRNEGREDDAKVSAEGKKDDLVAALVADDAKQAEK